MSAADGDVVRRIRRGDRDAFGRLIERYQGRLFGLVLMMVRERGGAEDVTQEAFVRAYVQIDQYDVRRPFYPWLASIAVRLSQNWLRRHGRTTKREGASLDAAPEPATTGAADESLIADERGRQIWEAVAMLPSGERTAVILFYRDELAVRDIATALGVTTGTIKTLLFRARRHLRRHLTATRLDREPLS